MLQPCLRGKSAGSDPERLETTMRTLLVDELIAWLSGPDRQLRAWLVSAQLVGLMHSWDRVTAAGTATAKHRRRVAELYGAAVQQPITPATT
ncbi:TetR/AcrR family transcriptional regulator [Microlunatus endophyticus]|uniref:TetR/AcrR family transcriptional regulator n=1 Tax=Microlunatus endophyticus TaxID=1716077 RepID=UPI0035713AC1